MLTDFGKTLRKLRIDNDERILDMAKKIGRSPAFVSSIEHGQKPLPDGFDDLIIEAYGLDGVQAQTIRQAYARSKTSFMLRPNTDIGRNIASLLAHKINELSAGQLKEINAILEQ